MRILLPRLTPHPSSHGEDIDSLGQYFRRMLLGRIFSSVRYLATVRRAIGIPRLLKISTISLSLNGALPFSLFTRSRIASLTLVLLIDSPLAVWYPGVKKYFISN